jgi:predicted nucleic acid-binding protein
MNVFIDTSSVFKLYHRESGTEELMSLFNAKGLIGKHWRKGLRTLDSIQLASALKVKNQIELFLTSDNLLSEIALIEGLNIKY